MEFTIDPEFRDLLPKLSEDERQRLVSDINQNGCRDKLVVWKEWNILIDGHNRYEICTDLDLPFETVEMSFTGRDDVKLWMIRNQLARRNITDAKRVTLNLMLKPVLASKAVENIRGGDHGNQHTGGKVATLSNSTKLPETERLNTRSEIAKASGVSENTVHKVETVLKKADEPTKEKMLSGEISINKAYQAVKPPVVQKPVEPVIEPVAVAVVDPVKVDPSPPEPELVDASEFKVEHSRVPKAKEAASPEITMEMRLKAVGLRRANAAIAEMRMIPNGDPQLTMAHEMVAGYLRNCGIAKIKKG